MESSAPKAKNEKLEAMRNKIKMSSPLLITKHKGDLLMNNVLSPCTPYAQFSPSPNSGTKVMGFQAFEDKNNFYLKNVFEERYETLQKLGEGANGVVRKCRHRQTNEIFAVKIGEMQEEHMIALQRIMSMMKKLKHENILNMKELYRDSKRSKYYQVIEYLGYRSLKQLLFLKFQFTPQVTKKIMRQLFSALQYFHKHHIVHRDIKTSNLLYDVQKQVLYVIDLGIISKTVHRGKRRNLWSNNGTLEYKAPEMLIGSSYNETVDNWAAGVVLYELVEGKTPFKEQSHFDIIDRITQIKYEFTGQLWKNIPLAKKLVTMLLKPRQQRLTAKQCLRAPWFQQWQQNPSKNRSPSPDKFKQLKLTNAYESVMIPNTTNFDGSDDQNEFPTLMLSNQLRMSSYETTNMDCRSFNLSEILGTKEDKNIINNS